MTNLELSLLFLKSQVTITTMNLSFFPYNIFVNSSSALQNLDHNSTYRKTDALCQITYP